MIIGARNSSNSVRLVEVAKSAGCTHAALVPCAETLDWALFDGVKTVAVSAGASAPETLVDGLIDACRERFAVTVDEVAVIKEDVSFRTPPTPLRRAS